jgi:hypothetical protein
MHAFIVFAAEKSEHSKTAFYIAGSLLAVWAVVLAAIGLNRPEFPADTGAKRAVMALSIVLVATAMASAVLTS